MFNKSNMLTKTAAVFSMFTLMALFIFMGTSHAGEPVVGKTYDKSNWQEIEDYLPIHMKGWLQRGEFFVKVESEDYDFGEYDDNFREKSAKNKGKFDIEPSGQMVIKATGEQAIYVDGMPFPEIDTSDPQAGQRIMENMQAFREHELIYRSAAIVEWVPQHGKVERDLYTAGNYLYYWNRLGGPIPNPTKFRKQSITNILAPYDIRGIVFMGWEYIDEETEDSSFQYLPMLRRVKRSSAAARSDPFMGSDGCTDDAAGWAGKNASMTWKYLGKHEYIVPHASNKRITITRNPDGSFKKWFADIKMGFETPGWQAAGYFPASGIWWVLRPCYTVEAYPKDSYYNYGTQIMYVDETAFKVYYKVIYNRAGEYWKSVNVAYDMQATADMSFSTYSSELYLQIDDKTSHGSVPRIIDYPGWNICYNSPLSEINPGFFTVANLVQLGK